MQRPRDPQNNRRIGGINEYSPEMDGEKLSAASAAIIRPWEILSGATRIHADIAGG